MRNTPDSKKT